VNWNELFQKTMREVGRTSEDFPWEDPEAYAQWLGQTYHFVLNSTRILALASARAPMDQYALHNRFIDHAKEERGHEVLLLRDLKALGRTIEEIPELAPTAALYKTQYFWIEHRSTDAFMGWVIMLEGYAANYGPGVLKRVVQAHGKEATVFWKVHAEEDQDHIEKALKQITQLPAQHRDETILNFQHCAYYYQMMLKESAGIANAKKRAA
jgi:pyrroloquinoline quinone (PQQ) biosynthesis protein C